MNGEKKIVKKILKTLDSSTVHAKKRNVKEK